MTKTVFLDVYWSQYILLEKEFLATLYYVDLDRDNNNTFSKAYVKLMLSIGSEIDVVLKEYCKMLDT